MLLSWTSSGKGKSFVQPLGPSSRLLRLPPPGGGTPRGGELSVRENSDCWALSQERGTLSRRNSQGRRTLSQERRTPRGGELWFLNWFFFDFYWFLLMFLWLLMIFCDFYWFLFDFGVGESSLIFNHFLSFLLIFIICSLIFYDVLRFLLILIVFLRFLMFFFDFYRFLLIFLWFLMMFFVFSLIFDDFLWFFFDV